MKIIKDTANIVVIGAWNKAILTPEWVNKNIFTDITNIDFRVPVPNMIEQLSYQYVTPDLSFNINGQRFEFRSNGNNYEKTVKYTRDILRKLIFTPVTTLGINIGFTETIDKIHNDLKKRLCAENDLEQAIGGETLLSTSLRKEIQISQGERLNITIFSTREQYIFDFNFDYDITDIEQIFNIFGDGNTIIEDKLSIAKSLLENLYNLELEY